MRIRLNKYPRADTNSKETRINSGNLISSVYEYETEMKVKPYKAIYRINA